MRMTGNRSSLCTDIFYSEFAYTSLDFRLDPCRVHRFITNLTADLFLCKGCVRSANIRPTIIGVHN